MPRLGQLLRRSVSRLEGSLNLEHHCLHAGVWKQGSDTGRPGQLCKEQTHLEEAPRVAAAAAGPLVRNGFPLQRQLHAVGWMQR